MKRAGAAAGARGAGSTDRAFWRSGRLIAVVVAGLLLRVLYVWMATVELPIRGDVNQYVLYAWNLSHRATFSSARPDAAEAQPDSYRGPGYPLLLAASMLAAGSADLPLRAGPAGTTVLGYRTDRWMRIAIAVQVALGTLTILLTLAIARTWLEESWALAAGWAVALWPHLISFTGVLLSETLFAFMLVMAVWLLLCALETDHKPRALLAGVSWGAAYLVNPVVALFPIVATVLFVRRCRRASAALFLLAFLLAPGMWTLRNAWQDSGASALQRVEENFVQGSWPQYHLAQNSRFENVVSRRIVDAIDTETARLKTAPKDGLAAIAERLASAPGFYAAWYLFEKPYLLWDWSIRIGAGDIYFVPTEHSAYVVIPALRWFERLCRALNPLLFALAAAAVLGVFVAGLRRAPVPAPFALLALLAFYLTALHVVLQAEPRYSVPYRPIEMLLAAGAMAPLVRQGRSRSRSATRAAGGAGPPPAGRT